MPRSTLAQYSFGAGVLSPSMEMRADSERYSTAAKVMQNMVVTPQGGATMRHGSRFIGEPLNVSQAVHLHTHHNGGDISDLLVEMSEGKTRFWIDDELAEDSTSTVIEIDNPYTQAELADVQFSNEELVEVTVHPDHPPQFTTLRTFDDIATGPIPFDKVPRQRFNDVKSTISVESDSGYTLEFNGGWIDGDKFTFEYDGWVNTLNIVGDPIIVQYPYSSDSAALLATLELAVSQNVVLTSATVLVVDEPGADVFSIAISGTTAGRVMRLELIGTLGTGQVVDINIGSEVEINVGLEPAWSDAFVLLHSGVYYECVVAHQAEADNEPGVGVDFLDVWELYDNGVDTPGTVSPTWFDYQWPEGNDWVIETFYSPWGRGWPKALAFHEQRLYLGDTRSLPTGVWGSRIGDFAFFSTGSADTDPVSFSISTTGTPAIQWMDSLQGLVVGTTAGLYRIGSDVTITPSDIEIEKHNATRSAHIKSRSIGSAIVFVQLGNFKILSTEYSRDSLGLVATDMTVMADTLFEEPISDIELMLTPETLFLGVRDDGKVNAFSFNQATQISAWNEWNTQGNFIDGTSIFSVPDSEEQFYFCIERNGEFLIEKIIYPPRKFQGRTNLEGLVYMDSYFSDTISNSNLITGIPSRFEGETVGVTVNDAFEGEFIVTGGEVSLPGIRDGYYSIGFRYTGKITTFERPDGNPSGVAFGTARRWNKLYARLVSSALPKINGQRPPDRTPASPMNLPEPLRSEDVRIHNLGFNNGVIEIEQDLPFPTQIVGLYGQLGVNDA